MGSQVFDSNELSVPAVKGVNTATPLGAPPECVGVAGQSDLGVAVAGHSTSGFGVHGFSQSNFGVRAVSISGTGLRATTDSGGSAIDGSASQSGSGVFGSSDTGHGVHGQSRTNHAVHGESAAGRGVVGISQTFVGVTGQSTSHVGVTGQSTNHDGVVGISDANGIGVSGQSNTGSGVSGQSNSGVGVLGKGVANAGVFGFHRDPHFQEIPTLESNHAGVFGASEEGAGVMGYSRNTASFGVIAFGGIQASALNHPLAGSFEGNVHVNGNVDITGDLFLPGADCAEQFDSAGLEKIEPGSVVVIDQEGALRQSHTAYDRKVAGVVSGAGKYRPGIVLDKQQTREDRLPVALVGKVYCKVDTQYGSIEVGDMLTSSPTVGHAMKAKDSARAFGAVIGKALRSCTSGRDLIPILVSLQ
jgi:hypothetical protein